MDEILSRDKILHHPDRLGEWIRTGITKPVTAEIDPTNDCNHNCQRCAGNRTQQQAHLSMDNMRYIIDQTHAFLRGIVFTGGGEPLMNPGTLSAMHYAREAGLDVGLVTNGSLLDCADMNQLVSDCTWIRASINAANPGDYSKKRRVNPNEFFRVWKNVGLAAAARSGAKSRCTVGVSYLTDDDAPQTLEDFARLAKDHGADYAQFRPYHGSITDLSDAIDGLRIHNTGGFHVICSKEKYERRRFPYGQAFADEFRTVISADGTMYPCCHTRGIPQFAFGNILEAPFGKIWESERRRQIEEYKLSQPSCPAQCYQDPLNQMLWEIRQDPQKPLPTPSTAYKEEAHINFV